MIESIFKYFSLVKLYVVLGTGIFFEIVGLVVDMWEKWVEHFITKEIFKMHVVGMEHSNTCNFFDMFLDTIQSICENYDCKVNIVVG